MPRRRPRHKLPLPHAVFAILLAPTLVALTAPRPLLAADGAWQPLAPPDARAEATAVYDPIGDRMLLFGGRDGAYESDEVWALSFTPTPRWARLEVAAGGPRARRGHVAVFDPLRQRMVVFGGVWWDGLHDRALADLWALELSPVPHWVALAPAGTAPAARSAAVAVLDAPHDRVLLYGGTAGAGAGLGDVWELSLAGSGAWTALVPTGTAPPPRRGHTAILDEARRRMVVFGGAFTDGFEQGLYDVWALSLDGAPAWTELTPSGVGPGPRWGSLAALDPVHDRMLVFGGYDTASQTFENELWSFDFSNPGWAEVTGIGAPPALAAGATGIYDPVRRCLRIFGGFGGTLSTLHSDCWVLALQDAPHWVEPVSCVTPPGHGRRGASMVLDRARRRLVAFGGIATWPELPWRYLDDTWVLNLDPVPTWEPLEVFGTPPDPRYGHTAILDPANDRMIVFGGEDAFRRFDDVWELTFSGTPQWTRLTPGGTATPTRSFHVAIHDPPRQRMVVFGGNAGGRSNDTWALSLGAAPAWTQLANMGQWPPVMDRMSAAFDPVRSQMVVFGGSVVAPPYYSNDVYTLALGPYAIWQKVTPSGGLPQGRMLTSMVHDPLRDRFIVYGGIWKSADDWQHLADLWSLSLAGTPGWTRLEPVTLPGPDYHHSAAFDDGADRMVVYGGGRSPNGVALYRPAAVLDARTVAVPPAPRIVQPWPNPAEGAVTLGYELPRSGPVLLQVVDATGRLVATFDEGVRPAGTHHVRWSPAAGLAPGLYWAVLEAAGRRVASRFVRLR